MRKTCRIIIVLILCCCLCGCNEQPSENDASNDTRIVAPHESEYYIGKDREAVKEELQEAGFTDITFEEIKTICGNSDVSEDSVASITIGNKHKFNENTRFNKADPVVISYYALAEYHAEIYLNMKENWLFNKYELDLYVNGEELEHLVQGEDTTVKVNLTYGDNTLTVVDSENEEIKGEVTLFVDSDMDLCYIIKCDKDAVELTNIYSYRMIRKTVEFGSKDNNDPLVWQVLDEKNGKVLLICNEIVEFSKFNSISASSTWERSDIRIWLNEQFYHDYFTPEERVYIVEKTITTPDNQMYGTFGGNDTKDRIFLLSFEEANSYFESAADRQTVRTPFSWWLRSMGESDYKAGCVKMDGSLDWDGDGVADVMVGVRPVMWVSANAFK